ncbi:heptosyltransferase-1 [Robbsia andropogonis]|uniref:lipopolysaccharide heptosyltransferase I n=2 Tax=Robbsia andropogonis TaxID=28092 RepID=UPI0006978FA8|nr:lipopolysaccharide heptosyltransferase I [Robbsia andropogonis]MCP1119453.1 lipopolysaccharide heptosyltransferase I [Robbsia andropogonis]MCP1129436.1 lipopolysaccharide heptosyltransferase I [Robbsia andropogonis]
MRDASLPTRTLLSLMKRFLIVKITSLGDVVMAQPVVSDIRRAYPEAIIDWASDEDYSEIPSWNPDVATVHCAPLRLIKKQRNLTGVRQVIRAVAGMRAHRYDAVIDIHGAYKSAIVAFLARAKQRYGYPNTSLGERGAAFAYSRRMRFSPGCSAVQMMREAAGSALGITISGAPHFGLQPPPLPAEQQRACRLPPRTALLLHGASKPEKCWPVSSWTAIGRALYSMGISCVLPWHSHEEHERAQALAAALPGARVLPKMSLAECAHAIESAALVIGVDTGLTHLAYALARPTVAIFSATSRNHFGFDVPGRACSIGDEGRVPDVNEVLDAIQQLMRPPKPPCDDVTRPRTIDGGPARAPHSLPDVLDADSAPPNPIVIAS